MANEYDGKGNLRVTLRDADNNPIGGASAPLYVNVYPTLTTVACGELAGSATALQLPSIPCKLVMFKARATNLGNVYLGGAGVTKPDATTDTTTGLGFNPGDNHGWIPVDNLNRFYRISDNSTDALTYLALG